MTFEIKQCISKTYHPMVLFNPNMIAPTGSPPTTYYAHYPTGMIVYSKVDMSSFVRDMVPPTVHLGGSWTTRQMCHILLTRRNIERCKYCDSMTNYLRREYVRGAWCMHDERLCAGHRPWFMERMTQLPFVTFDAHESMIYSYRLVPTDVWYAKQATPMCNVCMSFEPNANSQWCERCIAYRKHMGDKYVLVLKLIRWLDLDTARMVGMLYIRSLRGGSVYRTDAI